MSIDVPELERLGTYLLQARRASGLSQADLAERSALVQTQIYYFESGRRLPSFDQLLRIAKVLDVPIQRLLSGTDRPGESLADLAIELRQLGIEDLWVKGAVVPGAFRRPEEVIALALSGREPEPRVIEAIPALLAWNEINPSLLRAHAAETGTTLVGTTVRIAWLADIALAIDRQGGFPGGCRRGSIERLLKNLEGLRPRSWDDLGKPISGPPASPIWKRWRINYDATLDQFEVRARHLDDLRVRTRRRPSARRLLDVAHVQGHIKEASADVPLPETNATTRRTTSKIRKPGKGNGAGRQ
jgi:transcriptional regulator with XRE-family HTH domain